jgi:UDP-apiose/xylose synthase
MALFSTQDSTITVALVGAAGFIGSHLCDWILSNTRWKILALDLENKKIKTHLQNPQLEFIYGDYQSEGKLQYLVKKATVVINLASLCNPSQYNVIPLDVMESNYNAPTKLVNACASAGIWLIHFFYIRGVW